MIGVNNRNLHTFQLDLGTTQRVISIVERAGLSWRPPHRNNGIKQDVTIAALSGITSTEDVCRFREEGVSCVLIGETLMKSSDPAATISQLLDESAHTSAHTSEASKHTENGGKNEGEKGGENGRNNNIIRRSLVKICGLSSETDAQAALQGGASMLGVIFVPGSPRCATIEQAQGIVQRARSYGERMHAITLENERKESNPTDNTTDFSLWYTRMTQAITTTTLRKPLVVGVFQDETADNINRIVRETGIDLVQVRDTQRVMCHLKEACLPFSRLGGMIDMTLGGSL